MNRLYPPASGNIRKVDKDVVLQGYQVPKGTEVALSQMLLQLDDKHYPEAAKFLPERWLRNPTQRGECPYAKDAHPFTYLPFGFGSRSCIGKRFAEMELEVLVTNMIRNFRMEWHYPDMKIKSILVNVPDSEMKFRLIDL
jgi:cytochrome P450 family 12